MRLIAIALALPLLAASAGAQHQPDALAPGPTAPPDARRAPPPDHCRDRIETVREERGLPRLHRENAAPGEAEALMFHAVDRAIDGCDVLVMVADPSDVRPLPEPSEGPLFRRLPAQ